MEGKVALVTGAGSGIGKASALLLAERGAAVTLVGRTADQLEEVAQSIRDAGGTAITAVADVAEEGAVNEAVRVTVEELGGLDVVVANAGVMLLSRLDALLLEEWDRMLDVNVRGLYHAVAAALPHFRAQCGGHLVSVASVGAHEVVPTSAIYSATKFAAWAVAEGLRQESDPSIRVTTVSPGVTESELADHITDPDAAAFMVEYRRRAIPADAVARAVAFAIDQPADVDVNEVVVRPAGQR